MRLSDLPVWGQPLYPLSLQTQGSVPATFDLIIPFLRPGSCILVRNPTLIPHRSPGTEPINVFGLAKCFKLELVITSYMLSSKQNTDILPSHEK